MARSSGLADEINLMNAEKEEYFAMKFEGFFMAPQTGIYTFYSSSDDGTKLFIHDKLVVDNDYTHGMTEKSGSIALEEGMHPLELLFFQGYGGLGLEVKFAGPEIDKKILDVQYLYHK